MTGLKKKEGDSEGDSGFVTPDSTTKEKTLQFAEGEDILSHGKDGLYYLGNIVVVDFENERCLVHFDDNTAHWSLFKDLRKLRIPASDDLCVICKSSRSSNTNEIVLCNVCDQGYHQNCVKPCVGKEFCEDGSEWECPKCEGHSAHIKEELINRKENSPRKQRLKASVNSSENVEPNNRVLPYQIGNLTWDNNHKTNSEQTYCYCGGPGEWYNKMIQCFKCSQWFHEACVDSLHYPLLYGDRFYVFVCNICNDGSEFLHRLDLKWLDVVNLALFNLSLIEPHPFFESETNITHWITDNWETIQCPLELQNVTVSDRKSEVYRALNGNRSKFKSTKDSRKKGTSWGLRLRIPPASRSLSLKKDEPITHDAVKNAVVTYNKNNSSPPIKRTIRSKDNRDDKCSSQRLSPAKKHPSSPLCGETSPHNPNECSTGHKRKRELDKLIEDPKARKMIEELDNRPCLLNGASFPKRRGRPPKTDAKGVRPKITRLCKDRDLSYTITKDIKIEKESASSILGLCSTNRLHRDTSGDDTSSRGTLESFIPPPTNFEGVNNPFLSLYTKPTHRSKGRPLNKKLCERDIKIGKNGEIKRRRYRKKNEISRSMEPLLGSIRNCVDYALNARTQAKENTSLNGTDIGISLSELQSNVNSYFGASNRLASGDKFAVLARRVDPDGNCQYLVEWDAASS